jgi:site-specific DNA-methyltransferase (adenine-specific)
VTPPPTIQFSSVDRSGRARSEYNGIEQLAQSVLDNGLIQPLVLVPVERPTGNDLVNSDMEFIQPFGLDAGGRRSAALDLLLSEGSWDGILHHATTCLTNPLRPGYILKGEEYSDELSRLQTEIAENLDRAEMPWRDQVPLLVKAWKLAQTSAHLESKNILMRDYGAALGCGYMDLQAAVKIHEDLLANPERYKDVTSIRGAYAKLLKVNEVFATKMQAMAALREAPKLVSSSSVQIQSEPGQIQEIKPLAVIPLTTAFINCDSLEYMEGLTSPIFDHVVTDPDYAVSVARLEANMDTATGVHQDNVNSSLLDLYRFIELSFKCIKDQGFLVFWYDLDHHEKLQRHATSVGFAVQRWPLTWIKSDYLSNAAPAYNFTKNEEWAMVCRKPNAVLSQVQKSSVFNCATGSTTKDFNHPFAKPLDVWKWIFNAISIKGQTVFDPFLGSGSSAVAAAQLGLRPVGSEINPDHYHNALVNLQNGYRKLLGNVTFS